MDHCKYCFIDFFYSFWFYILSKKENFDFTRSTNRSLGAGYHIIQSKIAIGSGKFFGKGFLEGKQAQLNFLCTAHGFYFFCF